MKRSFLSLSVLLFMFPVLLCSCDCRKNCAVNTAENGAISQTMPQKKFPSVFPESWKNREFLAHEYKNIKPGIDYFHFHFKEFEDTGKPLSVYLVEIDWNTAKVKAQTAVCGERLQTVADMVKDKNPVVQVNGAYFYYTPPAPYFDIKSNGVLHEAQKPEFRYSDGLIVNGNEFPRIMQINQKVMDANETVIQGYWLGKDGKNVRAAEKAKTNNPDTPFTVIGLDPAKQRMILWVNDGRFAEDSPGISFNAIGEYLTQLGCSDVLSIDGGGSSTMVLPDENGVLQVMNHPSDNKKFDHKGARKVQNCFFLIPADH